MGDLVRGVIDEDVYSTKLHNTSSDNLNAMSFLLDIRSYHDGSSPSVTNHSSCLFGVSMLIKVSDNHICVFTSESHGNSSTNATIASGNYRDSAP
jgi:hypothetical protein